MFGSRKLRDNIIDLKDFSRDLILWLSSLALIFIPPQHISKYLNMSVDVTFIIWVFILFNTIFISIAIQHQYSLRKERKSETRAK
jgi:putative effector of murein hydrolase LrgA (UPF0299 family)